MSESIFFSVSFLEECYVVRPHNQAELHQLGAKGSICLLHLSPGGVTLALQVSLLCNVLTFPIIYNL